MKKIIKIGDKTYVVDGEAKSMEEVENDGPEDETPKVEETPAEIPAEETPAEVPADEEENLDEKVDEAAQKIMKSLGVDKLREQVKSLTKEFQDSKKEAKISALIDLEKMMKKDISQMTAKEKIVGFFQGMIQSNHAVLKALSEGLQKELSIKSVNSGEALTNKTRVILNEAIV